MYFTPFTLRKRWKKDSRAVALTEYGGYSLRMAGHDFSDREFGYRRYRSVADLGEAFVRLHEREIVPAIAKGLAAVVYTQLSDVEDELNGLLSYDRRVSKLPEHLVQGVTAQLVLNPPAPLSPDPTTRNAMSAGMLVENEITSRVALTLPNGRLNPAAIGWSRTPLHDTSGIGRGMQRWGRNKRWEYWAITSPTHIVSLTVSSLDYAAVHELWVLDRATGVSIGTNVTGVLGGSATLPASLGDGSARAKTGKLQIDIAEVPGGTRLRASTPRVRLDIMAARPAGHESLGVVVPWNSRQFQYTVKDVARPASGTLSVDGVMVSLEAGESWAVLDHGRGRWPYSMHWNWGAGSGVTDGRTIGIQLGSKWTDGTGATENALLVDGRLHKISENLTWDYSTTNWLAPWHIHGATADLVFTPFYDKVSAINLGVLGNNTHQCFGHYDGEIADSDGNRIKVAGILGWAEDVHNRW